MKKWVVFVSPDDVVQLAAVKMREHGVGFLPVCGVDNKPVGVITDRDIAIRAVAEGKPANTKVSAVMTADAVFVSDEDDLSAAEDLMVRRQKSRIMCTDDNGGVSGVISLSDLPGFESARKSGAVFAKVAEREAHPSR
jgi:CBS domain-containing protein